MDFRQTSQPAAPRPSVASPAPATHEPKATKESRDKSPRLHWTQVFQVIVLGGIAVLLLCIALVFTRANGSGESKYVQSSKYQAVFLENGQVYFGKIGSLTGKYIYLNDVYYLTQSTTSDSSGGNSYSLTELGKCQIHAPEGQIVLNRDQVTFWENLQDSGKVVTGINQLKKQFPNGQTCSTANSSTQASNNSSQTSQNSSNAGTGAGTGTTNK